MKVDQSAPPQGAPDAFQSDFARRVTDLTPEAVSSNLGTLFEMSKVRRWRCLRLCRGMALVVFAPRLVARALTDQHHQGGTAGLPPALPQTMPQGHARHAATTTNRTTKPARIAMTS